MSTYNLRGKEDKKEEEEVEEGGRKLGRRKEEKNVDDQEREEGETRIESFIISMREIHADTKERREERQYEAERGDCRLDYCSM
jgi:hypothetical protein